LFNGYGAHVKIENIRTLKNTGSAQLSIKVTRSSEIIAAIVPVVASQANSDKAFKKIDVMASKKMAKNATELPINAYFSRSSRQSTIGQKKLRHEMRPMSYYSENINPLYAQIKRQLLTLAIALHPRLGANSSVRFFTV